jgi:hypothetical protein
MNVLKPEQPSNRGYVDISNFTKFRNNFILNVMIPVTVNIIILVILSESVSSRPVAFPGYGWRRRPPDVDTCEHVEQIVTDS